MAGKNEVTLTFAGDHDKLTKSFAAVGKGAKGMASDVESSSRKTSTSFDRAGNAADTTYDSFDGLEAVGRGTSDTMSGLADIMAGNVLQGSTDLAGGIAALASGFRDALLPGLKAAAAGFKAFSIALLTNPIFLITAAIVAVGAALVIAYKKSEDFRRVVQGVFKAVGEAISFITTPLKAVVGFFADLFGSSEKTTKSFEDYKKAAEKTKAVQESLAKATEKATNEVDELRDALFKLERGTLDLERAEFNLRDSIDEAADAAKQNGRQLSQATEAGRANRQALMDLAESTYDLVDSMVEQGQSADAVGRKTQKARDEFVRVAQQMGATKREANALADQYGLIPRDIKSKVAVIGAKQAKAEAASVREALNKIRNKIVRIDVNTRVFRAGGGFIPEFHEGGVVPGPRGKEVLGILQAGEEVVPLNGSGRGGGTTVIELRSSGSKTDDFLMELLRNAIRVRGGDVQLVLGQSR